MSMPRPGQAPSSGNGANSTTTTTRTTTTYATVPAAAAAAPSAPPRTGAAALQNIRHYYDDDDRDGAGAVWGDDSHHRYNDHNGSHRGASSQPPQPEEVWAGDEEEFDPFGDGGGHTTTTTTNPAAHTAGGAERVGTPVLATPAATAAAASTPSETRRLVVGPTAVAHHGLRVRDSDSDSDESPARNQTAPPPPPTTTTTATTVPEPTRHLESPGLVVAVANMDATCSASVGTGAAGDDCGTRSRTSSWPPAARPPVKEMPTAKDNAAGEDNSTAVAAPPPPPPLPAVLPPPPPQSSRPPSSSTPLRTSTPTPQTAPPSSSSPAVAAHPALTLSPLPSPAPSQAPLTSDTPPQPSASYHRPQPPADDDDFFDMPPPGAGAAVVASVAPSSSRGTATGGGVSVPVIAGPSSWPSSMPPTPRNLPQRTTTPRSHDVTEAPAAPRGRAAQLAPPPPRDGPPSPRAPKRAPSRSCSDAYQPPRRVPTPRGRWTPTTNTPGTSPAGTPRRPLDTVEDPRRQGEDEDLRDSHPPAATAPALAVAPIENENSPSPPPRTGPGQGAEGSPAPNTATTTATATTATTASSETNRSASTESVCGSPANDVPVDSFAMDALQYNGTFVFRDGDGEDQQAAGGSRRTDHNNDGTGADAADAIDRAAHIQQLQAELATLQKEILLHRPTAGEEEAADAEMEHAQVAVVAGADAGRIEASQPLDGPNAAPPPASRWSNPLRDAGHRVGDRLYHAPTAASGTAHIINHNSRRNSDAKSVVAPTVDFRAQSRGMQLERLRRHAKLTARLRRIMGKGPATTARTTVDGTNHHQTQGALVVVADPHKDGQMVAASTGLLATATAEALAVCGAREHAVHRELFAAVTEAGKSTARTQQEDDALAAKRRALAEITDTNARRCVAAANTKAAASNIVPSSTAAATDTLRHQHDASTDGLVSALLGDEGLALEAAKQAHATRRALLLAPLEAAAQDAAVAEDGPVRLQLLGSRPVALGRRDPFANNAPTATTQQKESGPATVAGEEEDSSAFVTSLPVAVEYFPLHPPASRDKSASTGAAAKRGADGSGGGNSGGGGASYAHLSYFSATSGALHNSICTVEVHEHHVQALPADGTHTGAAAAATGGTALTLHSLLILPGGSASTAAPQSAATHRPPPVLALPLAHATACHAFGPVLNVRVCPRRPHQSLYIDLAAPPMPEEDPATVGSHPPTVAGSLKLTLVAQGPNTVQITPRSQPSMAAATTSAASDGVTPAARVMALRFFSLLSAVTAALRTADSHAAVLQRWDRHPLGTTRFIMPLPSIVPPSNINAASSSAPLSSSSSLQVRQAAAVAHFYGAVTSFMDHTSFFVPCPPHADPATVSSGTPATAASRAGAMGTLQELIAARQRSTNRFVSHHYQPHSHQVATAGGLLEPLVAGAGVRTQQGAALMAPTSHPDETPTTAASTGILFSGATAAAGTNNNNNNRLCLVDALGNASYAAGSDACGHVRIVRAQQTHAATAALPFAPLAASGGRHGIQRDPLAEAAFDLRCLDAGTGRIVRHPLCNIATAVGGDGEEDDSHLTGISPLEVCRVLLLREALLNNGGHGTASSSNPAVTTAVYDGAGEKKSSKKKKSSKQGKGMSPSLSSSEAENSDAEWAAVLAALVPDAEAATVATSSEKKKKASKESVLEASATIREDKAKKTKAKDKTSKEKESNNDNTKKKKTGKSAADQDDGPRRARTGTMAPQNEERDEDDLNGDDDFNDTRLGRADSPAAVVPSSPTGRDGSAVSPAPSRGGAAGHSHSSGAVGPTLSQQRTREQTTVAPMAGTTKRHLFDLPDEEDDSTPAAAPAGPPAVSDEERARIEAAQAAAAAKKAAADAEAARLAALKEQRRLEKAREREAKEQARQNRHAARAAAKESESAAQQRQALALLYEQFRRDVRRAKADEAQALVALHASTADATQEALVTAGSALMATVSSSSQASVIASDGSRHSGPFAWAFACAHLRAVTTAVPFLAAIRDIAVLPDTTAKTSSSSSRSSSAGPSEAVRGTLLVAQEPFLASQLRAGSNATSSSSSGPRYLSFPQFLKQFLHRPALHAHHAMRNRRSDLHVSSHQPLAQYTRGLVAAVTRQLVLCVGMSHARGLTLGAALGPRRVALKTTLHIDFQNDSTSSVSSHDGRGGGLEQLVLSIVPAVKVLGAGILSEPVTLDLAAASTTPSPHAIEGKRRADRNAAVHVSSCGSAGAAAWSQAQPGVGNFTASAAARAFTSACDMVAGDGGPSTEAVAALLQGADLVGPEDDWFSIGLLLFEMIVTAAGSSTGSANTSTSTKAPSPSSIHDDTAPMPSVMARYLRQFACVPPTDSNNGSSSSGAPGQHQQQQQKARLGEVLPFAEAFHFYLVSRLDAALSLSSSSSSALNLPLSTPVTAHGLLLQEAQMQNAFKQQQQRHQRKASSPSKAGAGSLVSSYLGGSSPHRHPSYHSEGEEAAPTITAGFSWTAPSPKPQQSLRSRILRNLFERRPALLGVPPPSSSATPTTSQEPLLHLLFTLADLSYSYAANGTSTAATTTTTTSTTAAALSSHDLVFHQRHTPLTAHVVSRHPALVPSNATPNVEEEVEGRSTPHARGLVAAFGQQEAVPLARIVAPSPTATTDASPQGKQSARAEAGLQGAALLGETLEQLQHFQRDPGALVEWWVSPRAATPNSSSPPVYELAAASTAALLRPVQKASMLLLEHPNHQSVHDSHALGEGAITASRRDEAMFGMRSSSGGGNGNTNNSTRARRPDPAFVPPEPLIPASVLLLPGFFGDSTTSATTATSRNVVGISPAFIWTDSPAEGEVDDGGGAARQQVLTSLADVATSYVLPYLAGEESSGPTAGTVPLQRILLRLCALLETGPCDHETAALALQTTRLCAVRHLPGLYVPPPSAGRKPQPHEGELLDVARLLQVLGVAGNAVSGLALEAGAGAPRIPMVFDEEAAAVVPPQTQAVLIPTVADAAKRSTFFKHSTGDNAAASLSIYNNQFHFHEHQRSTGAARIVRALLGSTATDQDENANTAPLSASATLRVLARPTSSSVGKQKVLLQRNGNGLLGETDENGVELDGQTAAGADGPALVVPRHEQPVPRQGDVKHFVACAHRQIDADTSGEQFAALGTTAREQHAPATAMAAMAPRTRVPDFNIDLQGHSDPTRLVALTRGTRPDGTADLFMINHELIRERRRDHPSHTYGDGAPSSGASERFLTRREREVIERLQHEAYNASSVQAHRHAHQSAMADLAAHDANRKAKHATAGEVSGHAAAAAPAHSDSDESFTVVVELDASRADAHNETTAPIIGAKDDHNAAIVDGGGTTMVAGDISEQEPEAAPSGTEPLPTPDRRATSTVGGGTESAAAGGVPTLSEPSYAVQSRYRDTTWNREHYQRWRVEGAYFRDRRLKAEIDASQSFARVEALEALERGAGLDPAMIAAPSSGGARRRKGDGTFGEPPALPAEYVPSFLRPKAVPTPSPSLPPPASEAGSTAPTTALTAAALTEHQRRIRRKQRPDDDDDVHQYTPHVDPDEVAPAPAADATPTPRKPDTAEFFGAAGGPPLSPPELAGSPDPLGNDSEDGHDVSGQEMESSPEPDPSGPARAAAVLQPGTRTTAHGVSIGAGERVERPPGPTPAEAKAARAEHRRREDGWQADTSGTMAAANVPTSTTPPHAPPNGADAGKPTSTVRRPSAVVRIVGEVDQALAAPLSDGDQPLSLASTQGMPQDYGFGQTSLAGSSMPASRGLSPLAGQRSPTEQEGAVVVAGSLPKQTLAASSHSQQIARPRNPKSIPLGSRSYDTLTHTTGSGSGSDGSDSDSSSTDSSSSSSSSSLPQDRQRGGRGRGGGVAQAPAAAVRVPPPPPPQQQQQSNSSVNMKNTAVGTPAKTTSNSPSKPAAAGRPPVGAARSSGGGTWVSLESSGSSSTSTNSNSNSSDSSSSSNSSSSTTSAEGKRPTSRPQQAPPPAFQQRSARPHGDERCTFNE